MRIFILFFFKHLEEEMIVETGSNTESEFDEQAGNAFNQIYK